MAYLVCRGDLRKISCDAWYLPADFDLYVADYWISGDAQLDAAVQSAGQTTPTSDWHEDGVRVRALTLADGRRAVPVLAAIPNRGTADWSYHRETLRQFVEVAMTLPRPAHMEKGRPRRLFAVPLIGTGLSGGTALKGQYIDGLLAALEELSDSADFDILLVVKDAATFSAVQAKRKTRPDKSGLADDLIAHAHRLGHLARSGNLVLFTGAGTGLPAGLPSWRGLLMDLAEDRFDTSPQSPFSKLSNLDQAELVASELGTKFIDELVDRLAVPHWAPTHSLLASLPTHEHVTLNYDELLEQAASAIGDPMSVLPYEPATGRWLLKLHGCVSKDRRQDIVLTRADYMSVNTHRAALTGIVQALLVTRHMLFIGFGLGDDHLHAVLHDVRRALGSQRDRLGTALLLEREPLQEQLWKRDLDYVAVGGGADAPRQLELFLDLLLQSATSSAAHLFDPRFGDVLTEDELALRDTLREHVLNKPRGDGAAWQLVEALGKQLGWRG